MFRRRHETSRAPAASAWSPVQPGSNEWSPVQPGSNDPNSSHHLDPTPPLPSTDPFGGWPAFPPTGTDPTDSVLGPPDPRSAWPSPCTSPAVPAGPDTAGPASTIPPGPATGAAPDRRMKAAPAVNPPPAASAPPLATAPSESDWLPLLTHADDSQRFQAGAAACAIPVDEPATSRGPTRRDTPARPRAKRRARRAAAAEPPSGAATTTAGGPDRPAEQQPNPAADGTTWIDPVAPPHPMEAAALAGAFAADYLSWDEQAPERRGQVLAQYLPSDVVGNPALLGWSGKGRQRAEFALPGAVHPDGEGRVVVDVRVRVTPYRAVGQPAAPAPAGDLEVAGVPAVAPAPTARGWKSLDSYWVRLTVPVNREQGRLVVDTWDEQLGEEVSAPTTDQEFGTTDPATAEDLDDPVPSNGSAGGSR